MQDYKHLLEQAKETICQSQNVHELEQQKSLYLGKKSVLNEALKGLGRLPPEERPSAGQVINQIKKQIEDLIKSKQHTLEENAIETALHAEAVDITLPGRKQITGTLHPVQQTMALLTDIFSKLGFASMQGPEIETDFYNFTALNVPPLHPARAMQDTFYFSDGTLLRSQMSPVQIHVMQKIAPPLRIVAMGRVYRRDFDLTHTPMFHQMECLMIDEKVSFAHLKGLLREVLSAFFHTDIPIRFRPSYFPFTEPSAEVDIGCVSCASKGCRICKFTGWLEILGCGMVHPNVLKQVNIDSERYQGFAFGVGIDRLAMLRFGINDLRALFENDLNFLQQF